jgi:hypothetical protein
MVMSSFVNLPLPGILMPNIAVGFCRFPSIFTADGRPVAGHDPGIAAMSTRPKGVTQ